MESRASGNELTGPNSVLLDQERAGRALRLFLVAIVVLLAVMAATAWHYRYHLWWLYGSSRLGLGEVQAIPDHPMPNIPTPQGWVRCRVGCVEFSLPPELAKNRAAPKNGAPIVTFQEGSRSVIVDLPRDEGELSDLLEIAAGLCPQSQRFTIPRLRRACYQASSGDFRWSMTPNEVRWHAFCIAMRKLMELIPDGYTESFFREGVEGIVHFGGERAVFEWETSDRRCGGYMHFIDRTGKVDPFWVRAVCGSLKVLNEVEADNRKALSDTTASLDR